MPPFTLGFDVYGTLVNPLQMSQHLRGTVGGQADSFAAIWREKQVEYAFRRGLMSRYEDFGTCTRHAMQYAMQVLKIQLSEAQQDALMSAYQQLDPYPDVIPALELLQAQGHRLVAFSNGPEATVRELLTNAGVLSGLSDVISVDDLKTFKPNPSVYFYLSDRTDTPPASCWLISGNPWDVIGAKSAGLRAAWLKRQPEKVFDPWGIEPDLVVKDLSELGERLASIA